MINVLLTGAGGLLGQALIHSKPDDVLLHAYTKMQLDITQKNAVEKTVKLCKPDVIINAAAYTQVDLAEQNPEKAYAVNREGAFNIAHMAAAHHVPLLHLSTDYVFNGIFKNNTFRPYQETDAPYPLNVYGASKLAGEQAVLSAHTKTVIVRTSSLFSTDVNKNNQDFPAWVLRQAEQKQVLHVIDGWVSCPTPIESLAAVLWQLVEKMTQQNTSCFGVFHYAGAPAVSRYEWAKHIIEKGKQTHLFAEWVTVLPCAAQDVSVPAQRPVYSALDCSKIQQILGVAACDWQIFMQLHK